jgi:hypothetical protein
MKLVFANAEGVLERLTNLDSKELPIGLFADVRRVLRDFKDEASVYFPKREKILRDLCTLENIKEDKEKGIKASQFWKFPQPGDEKFPEFETRWNEIQNVILDFKYAPIDYLAIIDATPDEAKKRITVKGTDFDVIDYLNAVYKNENSPADTSAGEANKGDINPPAV